MASGSSDTLIAVLGVTGAGKTTFVSKCTGNSDLVIGHGVESCTKDISFSSLTVQGKTVKLIDTPGFDDTELTDADVLGLIADFLHKTYARDIFLTGVILLQPVTQNRVQGSEKRRTRLFEKVCGPNAFGNVIIATTMWSELRDELDGQSRVQQRKASNDFWGNMVDQGAKVVKHDNTKASAINIVKMLIHKQKVTLQMQDELETGGGRVSATSAGQQLHEDLGQTSQKLLAQLQSVQAELDRSHKANEDLQAKLSDLEARFTTIVAQQEVLENQRSIYNSRIVQAYPKTSGANGDDHLKGVAAGCCAALCCCCCCSVM